jgi:predicted esterase
MFPTNPDQAFTQPPTVTIEVKPEEPAPAESGIPVETTVAQRPTPPIVIGERMAISQESTIATRRLRLTDGVYWIVARIESAGQSIVELSKPIYAINDFADRVSRLSSLVSVIKNSVDPKVKAVAPQVSTPFFQLQRLAGLNQTRGLYEINALAEFERIESTLSSLAQGVNPFANERGEVERAYQADGILVPYRLYIPQSYDGTSARPLVILLHGTFGDERTYFSGLYDPAIIKGESERRGSILLAINRTARPGAASGQDDAFEAINSVARDYKIDPSRIYLTGHSTGALGSLLIASAKPDLFAAMVLVSTGLSSQTEAIGESMSKVKAIPTLVIHGAKDGIAGVENSRKLSSAAQKAGLKVELLEVPETDHFSVVGATFPAVMQFFERNARKPVGR